MKTTVCYEWDYETVSADGDVIDHNQSDRLSDFPASAVTESLALVRDEGNEDEGVTDRVWAYVTDGKLPEYFSDAAGLQINIKVPQRFHKELSAYLSALQP